VQLGGLRERGACRCGALLLLLPLPVGSHRVGLCRRPSLGIGRCGRLQLTLGPRPLKRHKAEVERSLLPPEARGEEVLRVGALRARVLEV